MPPKKTASTPAQAVVAQEAARRASIQSRLPGAPAPAPADDIPVFEEVQETFVYSSGYGAFVSENEGEEYPDVELEGDVNLVSEAVRELLEHYDRAPLPDGPGAMFFEGQNANRRYTLVDDCTFDDMLEDNLDSIAEPGEYIQVFDPHTPLEMRVTMRRKAVARKRKGGKKFGGPDELWFDGHYAGLKRRGVACVQMGPETRASDVVRRLYAHYSAELSGYPNFSQKSVDGPQNPDPLLMPLWHARLRLNAGVPPPKFNTKEKARCYLTSAEPPAQPAQPLQESVPDIPIRPSIIL